MLKLGITTVDALRHAHTKLGRERHASFLLLEDLFRSRCAEPIAFDRLVSRVRLANGTWKQTASGRLDRLDDVTIDVLRRAFAPGSRLRVHDLAASTGVTSVALYERLKEHYTVEFVASDLYRDLIAVRHVRDGWAIVFDHDGKPLQYVWRKLVIPGQIAESPVYLVNRLVKAYLRASCEPAARRVLTQVPDLNNAKYFARVRAGNYEVFRLPLLAYRCLELEESGEGFRFETFDVLDLPKGKYDLLRAMNIITRDYMSDHSAELAIRNCLQSVEDGGVLVTGRSYGLDPNDVHATVFRVEHGQALPVERVGRGCEMEARIVAAAAKPERDDARSISAASGEAG